MSNLQEDHDLNCPNQINLVYEWEHDLDDLRKYDIYREIQDLKLNECETKIIKSIGSKGYFSTFDLKLEFKKEFDSEYSIQYLEFSIEKLIKYKLLHLDGSDNPYYDEKELNNPLRYHFTFKYYGKPTVAFWLTDLGQWFYLFSEKKNPVYSLYKRPTKSSYTS